MKLLYLTPGAGENWYCENCLRDARLLRALRDRHVDARSLPLYLPPMDENTGRSARVRNVYFGGINVYLQQASRLFRHTPRWLDRLFDAPALLRAVGKLSGMTDAHTLGRTTLSMLRGPAGQQKKELDRLASALADDPPDVLVFSNALLLGLAGELKRRTAATVLCWLQDEDSFLENLPESYRNDAWKLLAETAEHVDAFLAPTRYFASVMADRLGAPAERVHTLLPPAEPAEPAWTSPPAPPTIGYLSQFNHAKGADLLLDALARLRRNPALAEARAVLAGGQTRADRPFQNALDKQLDRLSLRHAVELRHDYSAPARADLLAHATALAVPARKPEALGLYILDAWASAVPVVVPDHGGQAELVNDFRGGLTVPHDDPDALADALESLLTDPDRAAELGRAGRIAVQQHASPHAVAEKLLDLCQHAQKDRP